MWKPLASAVQPGWQPICRQRPKLHLWSSEGHSEKKMDSQGMLNKLKLSQLVKCQVISPGHAKMQKSMGIDYLSMQCQVEVTFSFICVWPSCAPNLQHNWMGSPCLVGKVLISAGVEIGYAVVRPGLHLRLRGGWRAGRGRRRGTPPCSSTRGACREGAGNCTCTATHLNDGSVSYSSSRDLQQEERQELLSLTLLDKFKCDLQKSDPT